MSSEDLPMGRSGFLHPGTLGQVIITDGRRIGFMSETGGANQLELICRIFKLLIIELWGRFEVKTYVLLSVFSEVGWCVGVWIRIYSRYKRLLRGTVFEAQKIRVIQGTGLPLLTRFHSKHLPWLEKRPVHS